VLSFAGDMGGNGQNARVTQKGDYGSQGDCEGLFEGVLLFDNFNFA
jgi:hypothetical protein